MVFDKCLKWIIYVKTSNSGRRNFENAVFDIYVKRCFNEVAHTLIKHGLLNLYLFSSCIYQPIWLTLTMYQDYIYSKVI